jgi:hypothetical protein
MTYYTNFTQHQTPAIPNKNILFYNNRNKPKYTQGPQKQQAPLLSSLTHHFPSPPLVPPYPTPQISMLTPQLQLLIDIIIKASSI